MRLLTTLVLLSSGPAGTPLGGSQAAPIPLRERASFYHSAEDLHLEFQKLVGNCQNADLELSTVGSNPTLDVVKVSGRPQAAAENSGGSAKKKAFLIFGEHARELITSESALHFVRSLCEGTGNAPSVLQGVEFTIVPCTNPLARKLVEKNGYYCKRTNEHGVDLNRNWGDAHHDQQTFDQDRNTPPDADDQGGHSILQRNPGPEGFSEPETQAVRQLAEETRPDLFLSVHSGAYTLSMPWGFSSSAPALPTAPKMQEMLAGISERFCQNQCPHGALAGEIGYDSPGCSMDYAAGELQIPYAFTWEIYTDQKHKGTFLEHAKDDADEQQNGFWKMLTHREGRILEAETSLKEPPLGSSSFLERKTAVRARSSQQLVAQRRKQRRSSSSGDPRAALAGDGETAVRDEHSDSVDDDCFNQFNPGDEQTFQSVLDNWTGAYLALAEDLMKT